MRQQPGLAGPSSAATTVAALASASAVGRRRRLLRLGGTNGVVAGIAIDHRDSLRVMLERLGFTAMSPSDLATLKLRLATVLAPAATAIMLDAELGGSALEAGVVPAWVALIMPLEAQGYEVTGDGLTTSLLEDFSPAEALRFGAEACKLLLPYRADDADSAARQEALVGSVVAECHALGLPLVIEPVVYRRSTETAASYADAYGQLVLDAVARLQPLGPDLLKVPFPMVDMRATGESAALAACRALDEACADTPWVLLGAGADTDTFIEQIRLAGMAGAAGFLAGRGIWGAALASDADETERIAVQVCRPDLERCREIAERFARPLGSTRAGRQRPSTME